MVITEFLINRIKGDSEFRIAGGMAVAADLQIGYSHCHAWTVALFALNAIQRPTALDPWQVVRMAVGIETGVVAFVAPGRHDRSKRHLTSRAPIRSIGQEYIALAILEVPEDILNHVPRHPGGEYR